MYEFEFDCFSRSHIILTIGSLNANPTSKRNDWGDEARTEHLNTQIKMRQHVSNYIELRWQHDYEAPPAYAKNLHFVTMKWQCWVRRRCACIAIVFFALKSGRHNRLSTTQSADGKWVIKIYKSNQRERVRHRAASRSDEEKWIKHWTILHHRQIWILSNFS